MKDAYYSLAIAIIIGVGTLFLPFWCIPMGVGLISIFYSGSKVKAAAIATSSSTAIWLGIALFRNTIAPQKASDLVSAILGNIAPSLVFTLTGLVIGVVCGLAATSGKWIRTYLPFGEN